MADDGVAITLPVEDGLTAADHVGLAQLAERSGYDAVLAGEVAGPEVFSLLGRVIAGLGARSPIIVEGWYGRSFG